MLLNTQLLAGVFLALIVALVVSFLASPIVKTFAYKVGAVDVPKDNRRMHHVPIPRLGGLAIFLGFIVSILLFAEMTDQFRSILLGSVIIVVLGVVDDITPLPAKFKFLIQIVAALIPVLNGVLIHVLSNPNLLSENPYWDMGALSIPVTVLWIVAITNAVNLIDGLDGLAIGVSAISATTVLVISLLVSELEVAVVMAALVGACVGFMPYNLNPAKMFMGDTGATFLGYILACMSVEGLFKSWAIISFAVPFLILGLPIFDTTFAFIRRIAHGQSPMQADRSHIHHRLIDMGLNQKQAVATLYVISAILGLSAVVLTTSGELRAMIFFVALCVVAVVAARVVFPKEVREELHEEMEELKDHGHHAAEESEPPAPEKAAEQEPEGWETEEDQ
jgi:UDP-GlcNAc:undecaprenyl-phosphate GlcNAc-1-phosphate transferase